MKTIYYIEIELIRPSIVNNVLTNLLTKNYYQLVYLWYFEYEMCDVYFGLTNYKSTK